MRRRGKCKEDDIVEIRLPDEDEWRVGRCDWVGSSIFAHEQRDGRRTLMGFDGSIEWRIVE